MPPGSRKQRAPPLKLPRDHLRGPTKKKRLKELSSSDVQGILHDALQKKLTYEEISIRHCVRVGLIGRLVKAQKRLPGFVADMKGKEKAKQTKFKLVAQTVQMFKAEKTKIWKAAQVVKRI